MQLTLRLDYKVATVIVLFSTHPSSQYAHLRSLDVCALSARAPAPAPVGKPQLHSRIRDNHESLIGGIHNSAHRW